MLVPSLDASLVEGCNTLWSASTIELVRPVFETPFPVRMLGGSSPPTFGIWCDVEEPLRSSCAEYLVVHRHEGPDDFVIEMKTNTVDERVILARCPRKATLAEVVDEIFRRMQRSLWHRLTGNTRFGARDLLCVPQLDLLATSQDANARRVRLQLEGGGDLIPVGERALGRGEMYDRYFVGSVPFAIVVASGSTAKASFAAWIAAPDALGPDARTRASSDSA